MTRFKRIGNGTGDDTTKYTLDTSETLAQKKQKINAKPHIVTGKQIGRASCRERVCQYV